jgi:hypothetical protein
LNLSRNDELKIYQVIQSIEDNESQKHLYDNKSKFIKMVLKNFIDSKESKEDTKLQCRKTEDYMDQVVEKARLEFVNSLKEHDADLVTTIVASVMKVVGTTVSIAAVPNNELDEENLNISQGELPVVGEELPDEVMEYIESL